jgi:UPF0755 protein
MPGNHKAMKRSKTGRILFTLLVLLTLTGAFALYNVFGPATGKEGYLYIRTGSGYNDVKQQLQDSGFIRGSYFFNLLSNYAKYPQHVHAGKYMIHKGMSNYNLIRMLRSGRQEPVKLVINKLRTKQGFARLVSATLEADSISVMQMLAETTLLSQYELDTNSAMCAIMPDTYKFFWNTTADRAFRKIAKNYQSYWNDNRKQLATNMKLTPKQVMIIASIVEEETNKHDEKPNIASVYINRLRIGMRLQADPTVKYAVRDFALRRITGQHLQAASPFNTYMYLGLPPGPICTPSKTTIDAVLNAPDTKYVYFCARSDFSGYHAFASTLAEHQKNARAYQKALNERGIH